jgi:hypothetical protein
MPRSLLAMREPRNVAAWVWETGMLRKILHPLLAAVLVAGLAFATVQEAEAGRGGRAAAGIAAGIIGLAILGAASRARGGGYYDDYDYGPEPECYRGPRRCTWENRRCFENRYGDYVCRGGDYVCRRPLICD